MDTLKNKLTVVHAEQTPTEPDKSEVLFVGTATQLTAVSSLTSVSVTDVDLLVADSMRVLVVTVDRRLTFDNHASAVAQSCNVYHACAIRHIRHLHADAGLGTDACMQPDSHENRLLLHSAPFGTIQKLQQDQNNVACTSYLDGQTSTRCFRRCIGCLLNKQAVLTFKTQQTSYPQYQNQHISLRTSARNTLIIRPTAVHFISTAIFCQTIVQHCRTSDLELSATCCVKLRLSLSLLSNPELKLVCFLLLSVNCSTYLFDPSPPFDNI